MICSHCSKDLPQTIDYFRFLRKRNKFYTICHTCEKSSKKDHYYALKNGIKIKKTKIIVTPDMIKKCIKCGLPFPLSEFHHQCKNPVLYSDWRAECKSCSRKFQIQRLKEGYRRPSKDEFANRLSSVRRSSAMTRGYKYEVPISDIRTLIQIQSYNNILYCAATGVKLQDKGPLSASIDRIDSDLDYKGNIQIVSKFYNLAKHTYDDLEFRKILLNPKAEKISNIQELIRDLYRLINRRAGSLTFDCIRKLIQSQTKDEILYCRATNMPLINFQNYPNNHPQKPSIDRIDSNGDYTPDNIQITSLLYNRGKNKYPDQEARDAYNQIITSLKTMPISRIILPLNHQLSKTYLDKFQTIIFEDEWLNKRELFYKHKPQIFLRPQKCIIKLVKDPKEFYNKYHYIGYTISKYHIGAFYNNELLACMSIRRPIRQNSGDWEISRMTGHPNYHIHGIWSYILQWSIKYLFLQGEIISYSDKRLFSGGVYEKMGFHKDHEVAPDYYWIKDRVRYHKSSLRKTEDEKLTGLTEDQLRIKEGYYKLWDFGKIKWSMVI